MKRRLVLTIVLIFLVLFLNTVIAAPCDDGVSASCPVIFYENNNFVGNSLKITSNDEYFVPDLSLKVFSNGPPAVSWDNKISSIKIADGFKVTVYAYINYVNTFLTSTDSISALSLFDNVNSVGEPVYTWNNAISSFKIFPIEETICNDNIDNNDDTLVDCDDPDCEVCGPAVTFYEDENYGGAAKTFFIDFNNLFLVEDEKLTYDSPAPGTSTGTWNDQVSSLKIRGDTSVIIFKDAEYAGTSSVFSNDVPQLTVFDGWNDAISSFKLIEDLDSVGGAYGENSAEECEDNIDNDLDGKTDCLDPECTGETGKQGGICCVHTSDCTALFGGAAETEVQCLTNQECHEKNCNDNKDNDNDGLEDCIDEDCATTSGCERGVILYTNTNYGGPAKFFSADTGDLNIPAINFNNKASSLKIRGDIQVSLYDGTYYGGTSEVFNTDTPNLGDLTFNDKASSLKIASLTETICTDNLDNDFDTLKDCDDPDCTTGCPPSVTLYEDAGYKGTAKTFTANVNDLSTIGTLNDEASSLKIRGGQTVVLYEYINQGGDSRIFYSDVINLANLEIDFNDKASSLTLSATVTSEALFCNNKNDDDLDGLIDCRDSDCAGKLGVLSASDCALTDGCTCEYQKELTCNDGFDNDGEMKTCLTNSDCGSGNTCLGGYCVTSVGSYITASAVYGSALTGFATAETEIEPTPAEQPGFFSRLWSKIRNLFSRDRALAGQAYTGPEIAGIDCFDSDCYGLLGPKGGQCCFNNNDCNNVGGEKCSLNQECVLCDAANKYQIDKTKLALCNGERWITCGGRTDLRPIDPNVELNCAANKFTVKEQVCNNGLDDDKDGKTDRYDEDCGAGSIYNVDITSAYEVIIKSADPKKITVIT